MRIFAFLGLGCAAMFAMLLFIASWSLYILGWVLVR